MQNIEATLLVKRNKRQQLTIETTNVSIHTER